MPTQVTWPSGTTNATPTTYPIPNAGEVNWPSLTNFLVALGNSAQGTTFQRFATRLATTTPITVSSNDCIVGVDLSVAGPSAVALPVGQDKQVVYISDIKGDALTNNITITPNGVETIDGGATYVLDNNSQGVMLAYNAANTNWLVIIDTAVDGGNVGGFTPDRAIISGAGGFLEAATATSTEVSYLEGVTSNIQDQLDAKQATGDYITDLTGDVTASGPGAAAASLVATSNATLVTLSALTTAGVLETIGTVTTGVWNGTAVGIPYGGTGVTSQVKGSIVAGTGVDASALHAVGADGTVLTADSAEPTGLSWTAPLVNPMTDPADMINGGALGAATRLPGGTADQILGMTNAATGQEYKTLSVGTSGTDFAIVNAPNSVAFNLPDASATARGVVTTGTQTFAGNKTFTGTVAIANSAPTIQKFTASGAATYTTPAGVKWIRVRMVGGGGGGSGSGTSNTGGAGGTGGTTTFGTSLLTATGGVGATVTGSVSGGGAGGTATLNAPAIGTAINGGSGGSGSLGAGTAGLGIGGMGGVSFFGGAGSTITFSAVGTAAAANSGSGGGGGSIGAVANNGAGFGGGAGAYIEAIISPVSASYPVSVGIAGTAGAAGTSGQVGGAGGLGYIEVTENYI